LDNKVISTSDDTLKADREILKGKIKDLSATLSLRETIENTEKRIRQLQGQNKTLRQEVADLEKKEFTIKEFEYAKNGEYEKRINQLFSFVQFRLFKEQVDGQIVPDCECLVDGVLYSTLNNAAQIGAGLDIIKAISKHYNMYAPIFIDNRESVTIIPEMDCQIINLVVNEAYEKLTLLSK
jgi:DNA repair protein SbcC/Rad50